MKSTIPYIAVASEVDQQIYRYTLFKKHNNAAGLKLIPQDADLPDNRIRCYTVAGAAHSDTTNPLFPGDEDVKK